MKLAQFFEDDHGRLSMTRLMIFLSFWPASWVVIEDKGEATLGWYLSAYVLGYLGGKGADAIMGSKKLENYSSSSSTVTTASSSQPLEAEGK